MRGSRGSIGEIALPAWSGSERRMSTVICTCVALAGCWAGVFEDKDPSSRATSGMGGKPEAPVVDEGWCAAPSLVLGPGVACAELAPANRDDGWGLGTWDLGLGTWDLGLGTWGRSRQPPAICGMMCTSLLEPISWNSVSW